MKVSVLIVTFQSEGYIVPCIQSVLASDPRAEIIVVDNASTDKTISVLRPFPQVRVLANTENVGFSKAVNQASSLAKGDLLLLLNPDTLLCVSSIPRMVGALVRNPKLQAVGPISNNAGGLQSAKHWIPNAKELADAGEREQAAAFLIHKYGGRVVDTKLLTGFCLLIRATAYEEMEGLDSSLVLGFDDLDLCWRMSQKGLAYAVALDAFVFHALHKSFDAGKPESVNAMHQKSLEYFSEKLVAHYGTMEAIPNSMELWGVDWFTPVQISIKKDAILNPSRTVVCIWSPPGSSGQTDAVSFSVGSYLQAGLDVSNLLLIGSTFEMVDSLIVRQESTWLDVWTKVCQWFGSAKIVFVEAGLYVNLDGITACDSGTGPLAGVSKQVGPESSGVVEWDLSLRAQTIPCRWMFSSKVDLQNSMIRVPWREGLVAQSMSWAPALNRAAAKVLSQPIPSSNPTMRMELPLQMMGHLTHLQHVGVMGKGQLLDLDNQFTRLSDCDGLVWRLDPLELPGLAFLLKELRLSGLKRILILFDNAFYHSPGGLNSYRGVSPLDVRREVQQAGLRIAKMEHWEGSPSVPFSDRYANVHVRSEYLPDELLMATSSRLLLVCEPCSEALHLTKKVSIVLLALNQVEYTRKCIESIQRYSRQSIELILVNNGSTDGTKAYFDSIPNAIVIHNAQNRGVAAGWNQGIAKATGDYVLVLNNDTIVGQDCIENMVRCAENHPEAGMVVPRSNKIAGPQMVEGYVWNSESEIPNKSKEYQDANLLSCWEFPRLKGFCMLIPKRVVQQVGLFDEQYGYGNFEDDDYSCRVRYSGYTLLVADDSFLFHYGSVSFKDSGIDWNKQMVENMEKFNKKWAHGRHAAMRSHTVSPAPVRTGDVFEIGRQARKAGNPKDAFTHYCRALELDSSREDVAIEIMDILGKEFDAESSQDVLHFLQRRYPEIQIFGQGKSSDGHDIEWHVRVESLIASNRYSEAMAILLDVHTREGDGFVVCNLLGIVKFQEGFIEEASRWFERALKHNPTDGDALLNYYDSVLRLGIPQNALRPFEYALTLDPSLHEVQLAMQEIRASDHQSIRDPEMVIQARELNISAENLIREGMPEKAKEILQNLMKTQPENYRAINNLGLLSWYAQDMVSAWNYFVRAADLNPWYLDAIINLYDCAFLSHRIEEFMPLLHRAISVNPNVEDLTQIAAEIKAGQTPVRLQVYFRKDTEKARLREQIDLGHKLLDEQKIDSAVMLFTDLLHDFPDQVECLNGVGIVAYYRENYEEAYEIFHHALQISPLDSDTLVNLWDAAKKAGKIAEAQAILYNALSIDPTLTAVAEILEAC